MNITRRKKKLRSRKKQEIFIDPHNCYVYALRRENFIFKKWMPTVYLVQMYSFRGRILGRNWEFSSLLFVVTSTNGFYFHPPPPLRKCSLKLICNIKNVYGNNKSENSQYYAQKSQRNCSFMNSASAVSIKVKDQRNVEQI